MRGPKGSGGSEDQRRPEQFRTSYVTYYVDIDADRHEWRGT